jgi:hypothetical protein
MKKVILLFVIVLFTTLTKAQEKKTKTTEQSRSAKTGRYVTKKEAKDNPNTTYTSKKKK